MCYNDNAKKNIELILFKQSKEKSAYQAYNTKNMSCKVRHYYHKDYPSGWKLTTFCEQIKTTWYPQADYGGKSTITTHYRVGYSY